MIDRILQELKYAEQEITKSVHNEDYMRGCKNMAESCRKIIEKYRGRTNEN